MFQLTEIKCDLRKLICVQIIALAIQLIKYPERDRYISGHLEFKCNMNIHSTNLTSLICAQYPHRDFPAGQIAALCGTWRVRMRSCLEVYEPRTAQLEHNHVGSPQVPENMPQNMK